MEIYIVRHGQTDWNKVNRFQGQTDIPLSTEGRALANETAPALSGIHFDRCFSSPLSRATETAQILLGDRNLPVETDPRLIEMNFGAYEGKILKDVPELQVFFSDPKHFTAPDGETVDELILRVTDFFHEVVENLPNDTERILISVHGGVISAILCYMKGLPAEEFWNAGLSRNLGITIAEYGPEGYRIKSEAQTLYRPVNG